MSYKKGKGSVVSRGGGGGKMDIKKERKDTGYIYRGRRALGRFVSGQQITPGDELDTEQLSAEDSGNSRLCCEARHHVERYRRVESELM